MKNYITTSALVVLALVLFGAGCAAGTNVNIDGDATTETSEIQAETRSMTEARWETTLDAWEKDMNALSARVDASTTLDESVRNEWNLFTAQAEAELEGLREDYTAIQTAAEKEWFELQLKLDNALEVYQDNYEEAKADLETALEADAKADAEVNTQSEILLNYNRTYSRQI